VVTDEHPGGAQRISSSKSRSTIRLRSAARSGLPSGGAIGCAGIGRRLAGAGCDGTTIAVE
jgi:hypothetical protein